ncbi:MAG TPA: CBS domain-containing protein [Streptosporangiaceae bacterium]|nr:CBS domain-containing protein [Streptosporangiaceae bacterium]
MTHRAVRAVMTAPVATVSLDTPFKGLAAIMAEHGVNALPVLDAQGRIAGIVSQSDLIRKEEYQDDPAARPPRSHHHHAQAAGLAARDVMSSPAMTITPGASIVAAARAFDRGHVSHLVVIEADGTLAGIVTPRDLLKVYLRTDDDIRSEILGEVIGKYLGCDPDWAEVAVTDGIVTLRGEVERKSMVPLAARMTQSVDGVVNVVNMLAYAIDDSHLPTAADLDEP